jgi:hypothetical protein
MKKSDNALRNTINITFTIRNLSKGVSLEGVTETSTLSEWLASGMMDSRQYSHKKNRSPSLVVYQILNVNQNKVKYLILLHTQNKSKAQ